MSGLRTWQESRNPLLEFRVSLGARPPFGEDRR